MAGQIYISGSAPSSSRAKNVKFKRRNRKRYRSRRGRKNFSRKSRSSWDLFSSEETGLGDYNLDDYETAWLVPATCEPIQSVYFFSGGGSPGHPWFP